MNDVQIIAKERCKYKRQLQLANVPFENDMPTKDLKRLVEFLKNYCINEVKSK